MFGETFNMTQVVSDQSVLICMGGQIIGLGGAIVKYLLKRFLHNGIVTTHVVGLLHYALVPVYWIYMSDKLSQGGFQKMAENWGIN